MTKGENYDKRLFIQGLENKFNMAREYAEKGKKLSINISDLLSKSDMLIDSISVVQKGFKDAKHGLRGMSDLSEEVVTGIQNTSDTIQSILEKTKEDIEVLQNSESLSDKEREALISLKENTDKVSDLSFNIMIELQFQDILRQQVSAVASILSKTKDRISKGVEIVTGIEIDSAEAEEGFAVTDMSILDVKDSKQDDVDEIFRKAKEKKDE